MSYQSEVLSDSPLLYVRFEEPAGATCGNSGGLAGSATAAGTYTRNIATGMAGLGVGIDLDGTSGRVTYPDDASLDITGDVTYEFWLNADTLVTGYAMSKGRTGSGGGYAIQLQSGGQIRVITLTVGTILTSGVVYSTGTWVHVAMTRSGSNYVLYINGSSSATASDATAASASSEPLSIGCAYFDGVPSGFVDGKIDEVAVYSTALSSGRISAHYAARASAGSVVPGGWRRRSKVR